MGNGLTTPLEAAPPGLGDWRALFLKREDVHELGAFKWRGALPTLEAYRELAAERVVTASTGNHGAATAWAASRVGLEAVVFAPEGASEAKLTLIRRLGAEIRLAGRDLDEAKAQARRHASLLDAPFFEDGSEYPQYKGYSAIAHEIVAQLGSPPAAVVVPVGNGALLGGIGIALAKRAPDTLRVGVVAREAPAMALSWAAGHSVDCDRCATFADGLAVRVAIPMAVDILGIAADRMLQVSDRALAHALVAFARAGIRVEAAAAAGLAALPQLPDVDGPIVLVVTGRNIDDDLYARAVDAPDSFPD